MKIMTTTNELLSNVYNDQTLPLDVRYNDFLDALSEISDEAVRDRCYTYWISLYRYFDLSITNEQALIFEKERMFEILYRLDHKIISHQSEVAYQVRNILQQGYQFLAEFHLKYDIKNDNLREIKKNIINLENKIQIQRPQTSIKIIPLSMPSYQIMEIITDLKLQIKNLHMTRDTLQMELNTKKASYISLRTETYYIQQNIHKTKQELNQIQHELMISLQAVYQQNNQLNNLVEHIQKTPISVDQAYISTDYQSIEKEINNEQNILFELKERNKQINNTLLYEFDILELHQNKQIQLNITNQDLTKVIHIKLEEIEKEKKLKQEIYQILAELKTVLHNKEKILFTHYRQDVKLKNQIIELEHKRNQYLHHTTIQPFEKFSQSVDNLQKTISQEINHRLKLTVIYNNLKCQVNTLDNDTQQYIILVKNQREKLVNYEKSHDKWIINININRNRLLELFHRINTIDQSMINTKNVFQQFHQVKPSLKSNALINYNEIYLFIKQRREKDDDTNMNITNESKTSLNMKLHQMKNFFHANQTIIQEIQRNIFRINQKKSLFLSQISAIDKQRYHATQHLDQIHNKLFLQQQQILHISDKLNYFKQNMNLNNKKLQQYTLEKQKIIRLLLRKQHSIILIHDYIKLTDKNRNKRHIYSNELMNKIRKIRNNILLEIQRVKSFKKQNQLNIKRRFLHLQKELLGYKKKTKCLQCRIHQSHLTPQKLLDSRGQSLIKETIEQYRNNLQQKVSSIIYRLICKTHYDIMLHKRLNLLMDNIVQLYCTDQQSFKAFYTSHLNNSFRLNHLKNNQLKAYTAELHMLKNEILVYHRIYKNIEYSLKSCCSFDNK